MAAVAGVIVVCLVAVAILILWQGSRSVPDSCVGVVRRRGVVIREVKSGRAWLIPLVDRLVTFSTSRITDALGVVDVTADDGLVCHVESFITYAVTSPKLAAQDPISLHTRVVELGRQAVRDVMATRSTAEAQSQIEQMGLAAYSRAVRDSEGWGIAITRVQVTGLDVDPLPDDEDDGGETPG